MISPKELRDKLVKQGALQRLEDLALERQAILKILKTKESINPNGAAREVIKTVKQTKIDSVNMKGGGPYSERKPHWTQTPQGKRKMSKLMKAKYAAGWKGANQHKANQ